MVRVVRKCCAAILQRTKRHAETTEITMYNISHNISSSQHEEMNEKA